jgi:hypothetical protein
VGWEVPCERSSIQELLMRIEGGVEDPDQVEGGVEDPDQAEGGVLDPGQVLQDRDGAEEPT